MLSIIHSNRLERLLDSLIHTLSAGKPDTVFAPFAAEVILVPHQGMRHWITQQIAVRTGIAAHLAFPTPNAFLRQLARVWEGYGLTGHPGWDREELVWKIMLQLPQLIATDSAFITLKRYLSQDSNDLRLLQLAQDIAALFAQYPMLRPDWVCAWEQGAEDHWQARLWRALVTEGEWHWGHLFQALQESRPLANNSKILPPRISLFGIRNLAPMQLTIIGRLAQQTKVQIFHLNPIHHSWNTQEYPDGTFRHQICAQRAMQPDPRGRLDLENPILATLGHTGQILLSQLLDLNAEHTLNFVESGSNKLLHCIQDDLLAERNQCNAATSLDPTDTSIQIHACHSPVREIQVLRDRLLHLFATMPGLVPRDIVVMAVDMDFYAPYVEAIFGAAEGAQYIPWAIANRQLGFAAQSVCTALKSLLQLPESRFAASEILALLRIPAIQRRLGLDDADLQRIYTWVHESGIRWGIDAEQKAALNLPAEPVNTWAFGLQRLFLGMALAPDSQAELYHGVLPYPDIEGGEVEALGALQTLFARLTHWRQHLQNPRLLGEWCTTLDALCQDLLSLDTEEQELLQTLRAGLEPIQANAAGLTRAVSLEVFRTIVKQLLEGATSGPPRLFTGRVTFCPLESMSSVPFRVVCLLGMNSSDFPRQHRPQSFNLLTQQPRRGDRSRRWDDNALFLDALLSARDCLYISYLGHDLHDNSTKIPSVVVSELIEYIAKKYHTASTSALVAYHPLQPFSRRVFDGADPQLQSYNHEWLAAACSEINPEPASFAPVPLETPDSALQTLDINDLINCLQNPARYFLTRSLGLRLFRDETLQEDVEPFALDALQRYQLKQTLLPLVQAGWDETALLERVRAEGVLPHGAIGELIFEDTLNLVRPFAERLAPYASTPQEPLEVDLNLGTFRLQGWLHGIRPEGLFDTRFGTLRCKDRLSLWVRHLVLCSLSPPNIALESLYLAEDATLHLSTVADPQAILQDLLELRWQALMAPLPFFPKTAWAWYEKTNNNYLRTWNGDMYYQGESQDPEVRIAFRGMNPINDTFFATTARILGPLKTYSQVNAP